MSKNVTKRIKKRENKNKLWEMFDKELGNISPHKKLERLYSSTKLGNRDRCELCDNMLSFFRRTIFNLYK